MNVEKWLENARFCEPDAETRARILHTAEMRSRYPGSLPMVGLAGFVLAVLSLGAVVATTSYSSPRAIVTTSAISTAGASTPAPAVESPSSTSLNRPRREEDGEIHIEEVALDPLVLEPALR